MRDEDVIAMIVTLVVFAVVLAIYIALIVLGVKLAKRKNRSPHWMWFAIHPIGLLVVLIVMAAISPLKRCPHCAQSLPEHARLCAFCGYDFSVMQTYAPPPPPGAYMPPQQY